MRARGIELVGIMVGEVNEGRSDCWQRRQDI